MSDFSLWDGDGLPEDAIELLCDLDMLPFEVEGLVDACKHEAWVREKMAKHLEGEDAERSLAMARYFWRRVAGWKELQAELEKKGDD